MDMQILPAHVQQVCPPYAQICEYGLHTQTHARTRYTLHVSAISANMKTVRKFLYRLITSFVFIWRLPTVRRKYFWLKFCIIFIFRFLSFFYFSFLFFSSIFALFIFQLVKIV